MDKAQILMQCLEDQRGKTVVFLSHCLLNENTRYLGGACRSGCVREILESRLRLEVGIVQMPCPEQQAWGGVIKRWLLAIYGLQRIPLYRLRSLLVPLMLCYTNWMYSRLARGLARQIKDYVDSGHDVLGIVGVDGSPSCGVDQTLHFQKAFAAIAHLEPETITVDRMNAVVFQHLMVGPGLFTIALKQALNRAKVNVPFLAHDLIAELQGATSRVGVELAALHEVHRANHVLQNPLVRGRGST
jgi:uncharacterized protein YbbK (DUF523 family)